MKQNKKRRQTPESAHKDWKSFLTSSFPCGLLTSKNKLIDVVTRTIGRPIVLHMISLPVDPPAKVTLHVHCMS